MLIPAERQNFDLRSFPNFLLQFYGAGMLMIFSGLKVLTFYFVLKICFLIFM